MISSGVAFACQGFIFYLFYREKPFNHSGENIVNLVVYALNIIETLIVF